MEWQLLLGEKAGHGGRRPGAGRRASGRRRVAHRRRDAFKRGCVRVTSRVEAGIGSLRRRGIVCAVEETLRRGCVREDFRLVHYSIQRDHVHWIVEADDEPALGRGMRSLLIRFAKAVNGVLRRRGRLFVERFHAVCLRTPRHVRGCIAYVLNNARKHGLGRGDPGAVDPASSGRWFDGWLAGRAPQPTADPPAVARPGFWLLRVGWRRWGEIDPGEVPGGMSRWDLVAAV